MCAQLSLFSNINDMIQMMMMQKRGHICREYFADKMHDFGVYRFANGHRYEGGWHEGRRQGFGMYTFRNGDTESGHWDNGVLAVSTSSTSVYHAKVLKSIQFFRFVEKAVIIGDIDEKVNKSFPAANRAANATRVAAVKTVQNRMHHHVGNNDDDDFPLNVVYK